MFYSDFGFRAYAPKLSNRIVMFSGHFDMYVNSLLVRSVDFNEICFQ